MASLITFEAGDIVAEESVEEVRRRLEKATSYTDLVQLTVLRDSGGVEHGKGVPAAAVVSTEEIEVALKDGERVFLLAGKEV